MSPDRTTEMPTRDGRQLAKMRQDCAAALPKGNLWTLAQLPQTCQQALPARLDWQVPELPSCRGRSTTALSAWHPRPLAQMQAGGHAQKAGCKAAKTRQAASSTADDKSTAASRRHATGRPAP